MAGLAFKNLFEYYSGNSTTGMILFKTIAQPFTLSTLLYGYNQVDNFPLADIWFFLLCCSVASFHVSKVYIFWEGHKILRNLHLTFVLCSASQN